jgi:hypothetical protein
MKAGAQNRNQEGRPIAARLVASNKFRVRLFMVSNR